MKKLLHYICTSCLILCFLSCEKDHKLTTIEHTTDDAFNIKDISISNDVLEQELQQIKEDSSTIILKHKDSVLAFYHLRNGEAAWKKAKNRNALLIAIKNAYKEGLIPDDYNYTFLEKNITNNTNTVALDLQLTDTYLSYVYHLANGKINAQNLYEDWRLNDNKFEFNNILNQALNQQELARSFKGFKPQHKIYKQLSLALIKAKKLIDQDSLRTHIDYGNKIRPNKHDNRVISIRKRLNELGFLEDSLVNNSTVLDTLLQNRLKTFQLENNLQVDAIIGRSTVDVLNRSFEDEYLSILANLERWRWFPRNFGKTSVVVNIPQYQLKYITKEKQTTHHIVVGKTARKTPIFSSVVQHVDFNPKWFIPPTIKKEDIIPSATKNVDYLRKKNISVYNRQGKRLILDSINWNSSAPQSYRYVQAAGNSNALGRLKIIFPNNFSVYLHDTPSKSLFGKNYRAKSSGCVRVQDVFKLAANILDWPIEDVNTTIESMSSKRVLPKKDVNVHFLYWSVIFNDKAEPIFLNDVYQLDQKLGELLTQ